MPPNFGAVVLAPFPFTDQSGVKKRPAVIVSSNLYHAGRRISRYRFAYFPLTPPEKSYSSSIMHYFSGFRFLERGNERTANAGSFGQVIGIEDLPDGIRAVSGKLFVVQAGFVGRGDYRGWVDILDNLKQLRFQAGILA